MTTHPQDERFMQRALTLARETIGLASPNPQVGCVLVQSNQIITEGAHLYDLRDHAEIVALQQAQERGIDTAGATAYITLEPCSPHGRTGPCAAALIAARISRAVIATLDPNPLVSGEGIAKLRAAGIDTTIGVLEQPARDLNEAFAHFIQRGTAFVTLQAALSVDGKLAPPPNTRIARQPHWLTGPTARAEVQRLRHSSDAILTGIGTVLADNPALTDRSGLLGPGGRPRRRPLLRVILDTHLRTPLSSQLVQSANRDVLILTSSEAPATNRTALEAAGAEVLSIPTEDGQLNLRAVLDTLAQREILSLILEAGSHLNGAFIRQNLVDKAVLFYSETELGSNAIHFAVGVPSPYLFEQSFRRSIRTTFNLDACITGYLHDPWRKTYPKTQPSTQP